MKPECRDYGRPRIGRVGQLLKVLVKKLKHPAACGSGILPEIVRLGQELSTGSGSEASGGPDLDTPRSPRAGPRDGLPASLLRPPRPPLPNARPSLFGHLTRPPHGPALRSVDPARHTNAATITARSDRGRADRNRWMGRQRNVPYPDGVVQIVCFLTTSPGFGAAIIQPGLT